MAQSERRIILIDADVVSHFITAGEAFSINKIFPNNPIHILDKVHAELQNWPSKLIKAEISILLSKRVIRLVSFPDDNEEIKKEYFRIKSMHFMGDGESACLSVARFNNRILASSNLKDTAPYCARHKIDYLTTMDFLCQALSSAVFTKARCDAFIRAVLNAKGKLPVTMMDKFKCRDISVR